ncbi:MAG: PAS domain S-box protein [Alphaproteobacteria bacterium]|nr:PAS domain S-box protein [Alphaproteobacteria bacterium]
MKVFRRAGLVFLPLVLVAASAIYLLYRAQISAYWAVLRAEQKEVIELAHQRVSADLAAVISDAGYLARQEALQQWLNLARPVDRNRLATDYLAFATHKAVYDQVRFIDLDGREVVRIDWNGGRPRAALDGELQSLANRTYVQEALRLQVGQLYTSAFDLNTERISAEQAPKPLIHIGVPVFDAEARKRGIVVLSYLGQSMLERIKAPRGYARGDVWMLNTRGYWLVGPSPEDEWAFKDPARQDRTMAQRYPLAWAQINGNPGPLQLGMPQGFFTASRVHANSLRGASLVARTQAARVVAAEAWILVGYVPTAIIDAETGAVRSNFLLASCGIAILLAVLAWFAARHWTAREAADQTIRSSEARFRGLLEAAPDAVVITDRAGKIIFANSQTEQLFGYRRSDLIDSDVRKLVPDARRLGHIDTGDAATKSEPQQQSATNAGLELHGVRQDGSAFPVAISLSPVETEQDVAVFVDIRDVTEQRDAERQLKELNDKLARDNVELENLNKELEAFSYSVSHDLRTPLRAVDGFSQALLEDAGDKLDDTGRQHLTRVRNAAQRMGLLIDDLLNLARVTRTELNVEPVDLSTIARTVAEELRHDAPSRTVEIDIAPDLRTEGDPRLLRVALENLLGNAWKFTAGRDPAHIDFGREQVDGKPAFFVRDNGVGFDMTYAGKLFGAFQRLHDARDFAGTGIGLATVQRIIHKHGGRIWAEASPGEGATFRFTL